MGWELTNFEFENYGELASVFRFEVRINSTDYPDDLIVSGDGVLLKDGKVRLNREAHIADKVSRIGINPQGFIDGLKELAIGRQSRGHASTA